MRVFVYVDGFNVYYRALVGTPHKWLNPAALAQSLLDPGDVIAGIRYFTARVKARATAPDAPKNQQLYLSALATLPNLTIHYGRFLAKQKWRPLVIPIPELPNFVNVHDTEEKGSDVNLAVYLLDDAWRDRYDAAFILSQDTDLCEAMRKVKNLGKAVGLAWLDGQQPGSRLAKASSFVRHVRPAHLIAAQFASPIMGLHGRLIHKPEHW